MSKIYSRPRIRIPKYIFSKKTRKINNKKSKKILEILVVLMIAFSTVKLILDAVLPIFDTLCENRAKSIATVISNEQATNIMKQHSYDELFSIEKDSENNIKMIKANVIAINEIISDVALKIQNEIDNRGRDKIEIAIRQFYRL